MLDFEFTGFHAPAFDWALLWVVLQADRAARREVISAARLNDPMRWKAFLQHQRLAAFRAQPGHACGDHRGLARCGAPGDPRDPAHVHGPCRSGGPGSGRLRA
ncbi:MAG: hypothetical protein ACRDYX_00080 [Egibacteraceae bacterium]